MNLKTRYNLYQLQRKSSPSRVFKRNLSKKIDAAWNVSYGQVPWYQKSLLHHNVAMVAILVLVLVSGGGAYAYTDPKITEGDVLFPVKQALERVEEVVQLTPEAKAQFYLKKIERREQERSILEYKNIKKNNQSVSIEKKDTLISDNVGTSTSDDSRGASQNVKEIKTKEKIKKIEKIIDRTEEELVKAKEIIEKNKSRNAVLSKEVKEKIDKRLEERKKRLEKIQEKEQGRENEQDVHERE
jgi:Xaa-Pro aminopeptidase